MKRIAIILSIFLLAACKPDAYLGPLDTPTGNWDGYKGEYYFNGEKVAELDSCVFSAISFYSQGYCCIEGIKGSFPYIYDHASGDLQIDSTLWNVPTLTGAEMVLKYIDRILPSEPEKLSDPENQEGGDEAGEPSETEGKPDANGVILPAEYKGFTINADKNGYYYKSTSGKTIYCNFKGIKDASGVLTIDFWYDTHTNYFVPLVVETEK